jgi:ribose transport system substrate-binding protein
MKKRLLCLSLALVMVLSLVACGGSSNTGTNAEDANNEAATGEQTQDTEKKDKYVIGFSNSFVGNVWRALVNASIEQEAAKHDNLEIIMLDGQNDINKQVSDIENLIAQKVDAIMLISGSNAAVEPVLKEARQQGIAVVPFSVPLDDEEAYDFYVGMDLYQQAIDFTRPFFDKIGGKGNIVMLGGVAGNNWTIQQEKACRDLVESEYPDINILTFKYTDWKEDVAKQTMTDLLMAYPGQIDAVWTDGSQSCAGAMKAYVDLGEPMVPFCGATAYNAIFKVYAENYEKNPDLYYSIHSGPAWMGAEALRKVMTMFESGEKPTEKFVELDVETMTSDNFEDYREASEALPDAMFIDHDLTPENLEKFLNAQKSK